MSSWDVCIGSIAYCQAVRSWEYAGQSAGQSHTKGGRGVHIHDTINTINKYTSKMLDRGEGENGAKQRLAS